MRPDPASADDSRSQDAGAASLRRVAARAPARIDFGGGWTDVPPYPERDGGFVCNAAIALHARVEVGDGVDTSADDTLVDGALRLAALATGARVTSGFPVGAGLGGSSAAGVALQAAIALLRGESPDRESLARRSRRVEVEALGIAGGWQDHYAAAYGGALALDFGTGTRVERIPLAPGLAESVAARCLLVYTGETRISSANITAVLDAYGARDARVLHALARMATLAREMAAALRGGDIDALGRLVAEHWVHQRSLHPAITTGRIDEILARAESAGALGGKALGASGGGCVVVITGEDPTPVRAAIAGLGTLLPHSLDFDGAVAEVVA